MDSLQPLLWLTDVDLGPAITASAAAVYHADPRVPRLTRWCEPRVGHTSVMTGCENDYVLVADSGCQARPQQRTFAQQIKSKTVVKDSQTELSHYEFRCCVCLSEDANCITQCGHSLCTKCAEVLLCSNQNCPMCRQGISALAPLPGQNEEVALPDPDLIKRSRDRVFAQIDFRESRVNTRSENFTEFVNRLSDLPNEGPWERVTSDIRQENQSYDRELSQLRRQNPHLRINALVAIETGENYFNQEIRALFYSMYSGRLYDSTQVSWRGNLTHTRGIMQCNICHCNFDEMRLFDLHNALFHIEHQNLWPAWIQIFQEHVRMQEYPETRQCIFCELLIDDDSIELRNHFEREHLFTSVGFQCCLKVY